MPGSSPDLPPSQARDRDSRGSGTSRGAPREAERLRAELQRRSAEESLLARILHDLAAAPDTASLLRQIAQGARDAAAADGVYVERVDFAADEVEVVEGLGRGYPPPGTRIPYPGSLAERAIVRGNPEIVPNLSRDEVRPIRRIIERTCGGCEGIVAPLLSEGVAVGALVVLRSAGAARFAAGDVERLRTLSDLATLSLLRVLALDEIRREHGRAVAAEERYRSLFRYNPNAVFLLDRDGAFTSVNPAAVALGGYPPEEIIGRPFTPLVHPQDEARARSAFGRVIAGEAQRVALRVVRRDGELRHAEITGVPMKVDGRTRGMFAVAQDVTERVTAEAERTRLLEREREARADAEGARRRLEILLQSTGEGIYGIDDRGRFRFMNRAAAAMLGYEPADVLGLDVHSLIHHTRADGTPYPVETCPIHRTYDVGEPTRKESDVFWRKDGSVFPVEYMSSPVRVGGRIQGAVVTFTDISERKRVQAERERLIDELELQRSRLASLIERAPAPMAVMRGPEHVVELVNPPVYDLFGRRNMVGKRLRDAIPELADQKYLGLLDRVYRTGQPYVGHEERLIIRPAPDAPPRAVIADFVYQPLLSAAGHVTGIFVHGIDVTDLVRARREAERANRAKSQFLAVMSHELRTPLNAILGFSDLLHEELAGPLNVEQRDQVARIRESGRHLLTLIEQVLSLSRIEAGREQIEIERFDAVSLARSAASMLEPLSREKGLAFHVRVPDRPVSVESDPAKVRQILVNLIGNAIKFTERGEVALELRAERDRIEFRVSDTGPGIAPENRARIFEPFTQVGRGLTRQPGGSGLGLSVSLRLAHLLGGDITLESELGKGSTFTLWIPCRPGGR